MTDHGHLVPVERPKGLALSTFFPSSLKAPMLNEREVGSQRLDADLPYMARSRIF